MNAKDATRFPPCGHFNNIHLHFSPILHTCFGWVNVLLFYFLQIWSKQRSQNCPTLAFHPKLKRDRGREKRRRMRKERGCQKGTGPNGSAVKIATVLHCARCAIFSSTQEPRPRSTTEERRTSESCGDWPKLSPQVGMLRFYVFSTRCN